jgi:hypothetical protein
MGKKKIEKTEAEKLQEVGKGAYDCICLMVQAMEDNELYEGQDAREAIEQDALSVEVRSDWHEVGAKNPDMEFCILLSTGGPATRITGELDEHGEPSVAKLEVQDWFQPWTEYRDADEQVLLSYARCFYFGER